MTRKSGSPEAARYRRLFWLTPLVTTLIFVMLIGGVYSAAHNTMTLGFDNIEQNEARDNALRLRYALRSVMTRINALTISWGAWTEAYEYVGDDAPRARAAFEKNELNSAGLQPINCDFLIYYDSGGRAIFATGYDRVALKRVPLARAVLPALAAAGFNHDYGRHLVRRGIVRVSPPNSRDVNAPPPILVVARGVSDSAQILAPRGGVVMGVFLNRTLERELEMQMRLPVRLFSLDQARQPRHLDAGAALEGLSGFPAREQSIFEGENFQPATPLRAPTQARGLSADEIAGYTLFFDYDGQGAVLGRVVAPRAASLQSRKSLQSFGLSLLALGGFSLLLTLSFQAAFNRSQRERQLEARNFELLTRHLPDRLTICDLSSGATTIYGNSALAGEDREVGARLDSPQAARRQQLRELAISQGRAYECEWKIGDYVLLERLTPVRAFAPENSETRLMETMGRVTHLVGVVIDISGRKRAESEKEVLLREIHHRVKNNLQVVASMLRLQSAATSDLETRAMFQESQSRVRAMALIHEQLYGQTDLSHVDFGAYLRTLLSHLLQTYRRGGVDLQTDLSHESLDIDIAVPCGLIVTEIVTNAFKHAFNTPRVGRTAGDVLAVRYEVEENRARLQISDNGPGFPAGLNWRESSSLGLQIVDSLSRQIGATIETRSDANGTQWILRFETTSSSPERLPG